MARVGIILLSFDGSFSLKLYYYYLQYIYKIARL